MRAPARRSMPGSDPAPTSAPRPDEPQEHHDRHADAARHALGLPSYVGGRLLVLLATAILARLLTPADFGLVALALSFITLLEGVANLGLSQALVIQKDDVVHERAETVFASSVALGLLLSITLAALSPTPGAPSSASPS